MNGKPITLLDVANYITSLNNIQIIYIVHASGLSAVTKIECNNGILSNNISGATTVPKLLDKLLTVKDGTAMEIVIRLNYKEYYHVYSVHDGRYKDMVAGTHAYH